MKIIDAHIHVHSLPGHMWDSPPERLLSLMDNANIEQAIIMPYGEILPEDRSLLDYTIECVIKYPKRFIGFARMHPGGDEKGIEIFTDAVKSGYIKGLKFHPVGSMVHPADPRSILFTQVAAKLNIPILFHCGDEEWTLPWQIAKLLEKVPEAQIILGHMGGYFHIHQAIAVAKKYPNCYLETSATPDPRMVQYAISQVGAKRVLFGSDGPGCLPALEVEKVKLLQLGQKVEQLIFHDNINKLIGK